MGFFDKLFGTEEDTTTIASEMQRVADETPSKSPPTVPPTPHHKNTEAAVKVSANTDADTPPAPSLRQAPHQVGDTRSGSPSPTSNVSNRNKGGTLPPPPPQLDKPSPLNAVAPQPEPAPPPAPVEQPRPAAVAQKRTLDAKARLESTLTGVGPSSSKPASTPRSPRIKLTPRNKPVTPAQSAPVSPVAQRKHLATLPGIAEGPDFQAEFDRQLQLNGAKVREYLICAGLGPVSAEWAASVTTDVCQLRDAARAAGKNREVRTLEQALRALAAFSLADAKSARLLADLSELLPGKLSIGDEIASRELLLVDNLVRLIPEVRKPTVEKLKQGSMWSLKTLHELELAEAATQSGIDSQCLARIRDLVKEHLERRKAWHPVPRSQIYKESLEETLRALERFESEFEEADRDEDRELKRKAREARRQAALRVNLMLVESGALDTLATVERMSVADKITHLRVANGE